LDKIDLNELSLCEGGVSKPMRSPLKIETKTNHLLKLLLLNIIFNPMKLSTLIACISLGGYLSISPLTSIASAELSVATSPLLVAELDRTTAQDEARRWGIRLNGYQIDYYKKHGVFAKTTAQIITVMDQKSSDYSFDRLKEVQQIYDFIIKEKPDAIYMYTTPRVSGYRAYSTATFFKRGANRTLLSQQSRGCNSTNSPAPEPALGNNTCPGQKDPMSDFFKESPSQSSQSSPAPSNPAGDGLLNEVKKKAPGIFNIFK
jgi:hypothetical protein